MVHLVCDKSALEYSHRFCQYSDICLTFGTALLLIIAGLIFQFDFFLKNDFGTYFFLFFLFGLSMVSLAMLLSMFLSKARTGNITYLALYDADS